jgi:hypothetical protein
LTLRLRDTADRLWLYSLGWRLPQEEAGNGALAQLTADAVRLAAWIADLNGVPAAELDHVDRRRDETR